MTLDEFDWFNERAGIREYLGNLPRDEAERLAREDVERARREPNREPLHRASDHRARSLLNTGRRIA